MSLVVDAGPLLAQADRKDPDHAAVSELLRSEQGDLVLSAFATAEADHLILRALGLDAELGFLQDLVSGTYRVETLTTVELGRAKSIVERYRDLRLGLTDASMVVLAARYKTTRILTFDERHFRAITPLQGGHFTILPADG